MLRSELEAISRLVNKEHYGICLHQTQMRFDVATSALNKYIAGNSIPTSHSLLALLEGRLILMFEESQCMDKLLSLNRKPHPHPHQVQLIDSCYEHCPRKLCRNVTVKSACRSPNISLPKLHRSLLIHQATHRSTWSVSFCGRDPRQTHSMECF